MIRETTVMPTQLTAENGAKSLMTGEFFEMVEIECQVCDQDDLDCKSCRGNGSNMYRVAISWSSIKEIYAKAVEHFDS